MSNKKPVKAKAEKKSRKKTLEMLAVSLAIAKERQKAAEKSQKRLPGKKGAKKGIEAVVRESKKGREKHDNAMAYGQPLEQAGMVDHEKLFSYLGSGAKPAEYNESDYAGKPKEAFAAVHETISMKDVYEIIRQKKKEDLLSGGASTSYKLRKDYEAFQYWNLFNNALNRAFYDIIMCIDISH